jgi:Domain of unknown function (DUF1844)
LNPPAGVLNLHGMGTGDPKATGFTINDRRAFTEAGESRDGRERNDGQARAEGPPGPTDEPSDKSTLGLPAVDFHTFVLSLGSSALLHLGELEHPDVGAPQKDLPLAKHTIDILAMLEQKTKGNLTSAEAKLIESLLYDLRLRFVELSKG